MALLALLAGLVAGCGTSQSAVSVGVLDNGWKMTWDDEFTGGYGAAPSAAKWSADVGRFSDAEWEYYAPGGDNASLDGHGHLAITARRADLPGMAPCPVGSCDISSARLTTRGHFSQRYGMFTARMRIPSGQGLWPAFWLLGADCDKVHWPACGELDVMEAVGVTPRIAYGTAHASGYATPGLGGNYSADGSALSDGFHVYALQWTPDSLTWFVDGNAYYSLSRSTLRKGQSWPFDRPFYLIFNLAVGGEWPGPPSSATQLPATLLIDWVRVYQHS